MTPLDLLIPVAHAQTAGAPAGPSMLSTLMFPILLLAIMYFLMIRPQMKRAKEHQAMVSKLAVGDEVITNGGVAGTVRALGDNFISVEVSEGVVLRVQRSAITSTLPKGTLKAA